MKTSNAHSLRPIFEQITNNTTGWIGHHPKNDNEISKGQTFIASSAADIESIEVFSNIVSKPGNVMMTIHNFDPQQNSWGPALSSSNVEIKKSDTGKWIAFEIPTLHLDQGKSYGFRLESHDSFIGVGEAAGSANNPPYSNGQEWQFTNDSKNTDTYSYFSLAFKVGKRA